MDNSIEDYAIQEQIGKGGFACVYRAVCKCNGLEVAVKIIDKQLMQAAGMCSRVRQEVQIHSTLRHASILQLYTFFEDSLNVYLVLELCRNGELASYVRSRGRLDDAEAREYMRQIVAGVAYLNQHQILHRDLSLSNLLLDDNFRVKIADFGLATQLRSGDEQRHRTMCGTPNYISPEVATRSWHGPQADVWALGCMLYTMLVGRPPFDTDGVRSTLTRVVMADAQYPEHVSPEARDLMSRLLQKEPSKRLQLSAIMQHAFMNDGALVQDVYTSSAAAVDYDKCSAASMGNGSWSVAADSGLGATINTVSSAPPLLSRSTRTNNSQPRQPAQCDPPATPVVGAAGTARALNRRVCSLDRAVASSRHQRQQSDISQSSTAAASDGGAAQWRRRQRPHVPQCRTPLVPPYCQQTPDAPRRHHSPFVQDRVKSPAVMSPDLGAENASFGSGSRARRNQHDGISVNSAAGAESTDSNNRVLQGLQRPYAAALQADSCGAPPVSPLNTRRLSSTRQRSKNAAFSVTDDGSVCLEFVRTRRDKHVVVDVCRISADGQRVVMYRPEGGYVALSSEPPAVPAAGADHFYNYNTLPQIHWKKYVYAARFVKMVKAKTAKLTVYTEEAKCVMMENSPSADMEVYFYEGGYVTRNTGRVTIREKGLSSGSAECDTDYVQTIDTDKDVSHLNTRALQLWRHFQQCVQQCERIEAALTSLQTDTQTYFPVIIGRRPSRCQTLTTLKATSSNKENMFPSHGYTQRGVDGSVVSGQAAVGGSIHGSVLSGHSLPRSTVSVKTAASSSRTQPGAQIRVEGVGFATQLADGVIEVHCDDGCRVSIDPRSGRLVTRDPTGLRRVYTRQDPLPFQLKGVMQQLPDIVHALVNPHTHR